MALKYSPQIVTDGLYLALDARDKNSYPGSGTTWYDISGNGYNGTLTNGAYYSNGDIIFDGIDDYMVSYVGGSTTLNGDPNFTVEFFAKRTTDFIYGGFWGIGGGGQGNAISGWTPTTNLIHIDVYDSTRLASPSYYPLNQYVHVAWAKEGTSISTSTVKLYVNGVLTGLTLTRSQTTGPQYNTSSTGIVLGRIVSDQNANYAPINMGCFRVYSRALSATEVTQNYNSQKSRFGL